MARSSDPVKLGNVKTLLQSRINRTVFSGAECVLVTITVTELVTHLVTHLVAVT